MGTPADRHAPGTAYLPGWLTSGGFGLSTHLDALGLVEHLLHVLEDLAHRHVLGVDDPERRDVDEVVLEVLQVEALHVLETGSGFG